MNTLNFIQLVEQRLSALEERLTQLADQRLTEEVKKTLSIARVDLPFSLAKARYVLELVIRDIYQRELPQEKPKPLFNMIEALCQVEGLFTKKLATDVNYIRINGNLIVHVQEETVEIQERDVEVLILVILNLVEWYLVRYIPEKTGARVAPPVVHAIPPNPYRGLEAFREEDSGRFFGRDKEAADLAAQVAERPLVAVVGASGSGKSSLVYAGLFPRLRAQGHWRLAAFRPQNHPFYELAKVIAGLLYEDKLQRAAKTKALVEQLEGGQVELAHVVDLVLEGRPERLLLVVDQFEELYTLNPDKGVQQRFVDLLLRGLEIPPNSSLSKGGTAFLPFSKGGSGGMCLLLTLRADFMGYALAYAPLAKALDRPKLLGPVDDAEKWQAIIEQPAQQREVTWEPLLVERILRDLRELPVSEGETERISLPLLQFTLEQLWQRQTERMLTHVAYEELGGVQRALARHADTVLTHFAAEDKERLRRIFVQLVRPGEGTEDTRQVATKAHVGEANWGLVSRLADERLVVSGRDEASREETVEIIHETLIQNWPQLRRWLESDRSFRLWQERLRAAMRQWENSGKDAGALLRGLPLAEAEGWLRDREEDLAERERDFIRTSTALREREWAAQQRSRRNRLWALTAGLVVTTSFALFAGWQWQEARAQRDIAREQRAHAESQQLAAQAELLGKQQANLLPQSVLLATESMKTFSTFSADQALYHSLSLLGPKPVAERSYRGLLNLILSPHGKYLVQIPYDGPAEVQETVSGKAIASLINLSPDNEPLWAVNQVSFSADENRIATLSSLGISTFVWELPSGREIFRTPVNRGAIIAAVLSGDGNYLATGHTDGMVYLWKISSGDEVLNFSHLDPPHTIKFSPDGMFLAISSSIGLRGSPTVSMVRLWNLVKNQEIAQLQ